MKHTITKLPQSQISITVTIPEDVFLTYKEHALEHLGRDVEVPGFRKGKAPKEVVEKELKPFHILEEMAEHAVNEHLPRILMEEKIDAIGRPMISLTKLAEGNPFEFTATVDVLPEVTLADYKKLAKEANKEDITVTVTDEEFEKAIIELKKARAAQEKQELPEEVDASLTDEYVSALGPFKTVDEFKEKFRQNILDEKKSREIEKKRIALMEQIIAGTTVELPETLIANEIESIIARMHSDVARIGMQFDDYLKHLGKSEDELRTELRPDAQKKAAGELIIYHISKKEDLKPDTDRIEQETKQVLEFYKGADPERTRAYVTHLLTNEAVFTFLESQK